MYFLLHNIYLITLVTIYFADYILHQIQTCVIYQYFWYFRLFTQALFAWFYQSNILKYLYFY